VTRRVQGRTLEASLLALPFSEVPVPGLFDVTTASLEVALRGASARQGTLANNLANVNTPGFKRSDVRFEDALANALDSTSRTPGSVGAVRPTTVQDQDTTMRADGNNVDVDRENVELAKTHIIYETAMAIEAKKLRQLSSLITSAR
jgi:flagellar basal-body rod protein FlgB